MGATIRVNREHFLSAFLFLSAWLLNIYAHRKTVNISIPFVNCLQLKRRDRFSNWPFPCEVKSRSVSLHGPPSGSSETRYNTFLIFSRVTVIAVNIELHTYFYYRWFFKNLFRYEETGPRSGTCHADNETECIGGIARVSTVAKQLIKDRPNPIFLNAGDNFQGTFWYNVHRWNVTGTFMNLLPHDAMVNLIKRKINAEIKISRSYFPIRTPYDSFNWVTELTIDYLNEALTRIPRESDKNRTDRLEFRG